MLYAFGDCLTLDVRCVIHVENFDLMGMPGGMSTHTHSST
jgi:hypothetical protein